MRRRGAGVLAGLAAGLAVLALALAGSASSAARSRSDARTARASGSARAARAQRAARTPHAVGGTRALARRSARAKPFELPPVRHIFVIMEENEDYASTFGEPSADPYLAQALPSRGALLSEYFAIGHESNDNYVALVSGQPPNPENQADCQLYDNFLDPGTEADGVETGVGCVYPAAIANIGTQLSAAKKTWKAYEQDMGNDPDREAAACGHPALEGKDETQDAVEGDGYAARHDPFVYFHSVIDDQRYCDDHVVALGGPNGEMPADALKGETGLATDLKHVSSTPAFSLITPNLCEDGHDYPCKNEPSGASALADIDRFLETWVPKITSSPAFKKNGLLMITFDESDGPQSDSSSCCEEKPGPASPLPGITGPGGGRIGAVLLSPFIKPGTVSDVSYNHYSALASFESLLGLPRLAYAASVPATFGADVFTAAK
ncbi:MAG TPA: alkaline phosphatase family protein [Solirubrobacteraceae bacterium]|nr:alkaline phosphatase family protein [Solirubrobacteraceae bacterium]